MMLLEKLKKYLSGKKRPLLDTDPARAYDLWSQEYDAQPDNLMLALDERLFARMLNNISIKNRFVVDVGCGTGRHWPEIMLQQPTNLTGYDISIGMLNKLKEKFPQATVHQLENNRLVNLEEGNCDVIISTLTIAHIENISEAFTEWDRVLKSDGEVLITDYHPEAFMRGGDRTFVYNGQIVSIKNYVHKIDDTLSFFFSKGYELKTRSETRIDDSMQKYYEEKRALRVFEKFRNVPIIYGLHLKKGNAATQS